MNAMTNFTIKSQRANRVRTFVTILGVALAAALLTAILTTYTSLCDFLYRAEAATSGEWMAEVESDDSARLKGYLAAADDSPDVTEMAVIREVGFGELNEDQQAKLGQYQAIASAEGDISHMLGIYPSEGRLPESSGEILLYAGWDTYEDVEIGDEITFQVGQRMAVAPGGSAEDVLASGGADGDSGEGSLDGTGAFETSRTDNPDKMMRIEAGSRLGMSTGYLESSADVDLDEVLVDKETQTYTVVGFYNRMGYALSSSVGTVAITTNASQASDFAEVYLTLDGVSSAAEVRERAQELFPEDNVILHTAMLRFMGISDDISLWSTFYGLVIVLAAVIIFACVSLIFNAFAISVAERMSQFALLSSVGATRRQIRRAVMLEALFVALIGLPLGILIGIGGCAATFAILGPAIAELAADGVVSFDVKVNAWVIAITAALTTITVLVSVWIPAIRAGRINIIESLRNSGSSRISKKGERLANKMTTPSKLWRQRGVMDRLFGVGGKLACINRKRGSTKGRTAAVSLALAIVLLMTAGSLNSFLGTLVNAVSGGNTPSGDVTVSAQFDVKSPTPEAPISSAEMLQIENDSFAKEAEAFAGAYDYLSTTENADPRGWMLYSTLPVILPASMAGSGFDDSGIMFGGKMDSGEYAAEAHFCFVDDASFDEYASSLGLDPKEFHDGGAPRAIGLSQAFGNNGSMYQVLEALKDTGEASVLAGATYMDRYPAHINLYSATRSDGSEFAEFVPVVVTQDDTSFGAKDLSMSDVSFTEIPFEAAALSADTPSIVGGNSAYLSFIFPMSLAQSQGFGIEMPVFKSAFDAIDGDHAALAEALTTRGGEFFHDNTDFELAFYSYNDTVAEIDSAQMLATIVNVFCLLFTVILALIAMANVFNTVTNSLILRRREFAVMKSIGLSNRQFRRMIMDECMNFGVKGLIPGLLISVAISYLIYMMIGQSMSGMMFALPWGYVALSIAMTAVAMGVSVAYGMHRCKADNVVEALRSDGI